MAVKKAIGLYDRDRRQSVAGNIGIEILDVLIVGAQRRIGHDLRRVQKWIADVTKGTSLAILLAAVPSFAVILPGDMMFRQQKPQIVLRRGRNCELSRTERRGSTVAQIAWVVVID